MDRCYVGQAHHEVSRPQRSAARPASAHDAAQGVLCSVRTSVQTDEDRRNRRAGPAQADRRRAGRCVRARGQPGGGSGDAMPGPQAISVGDPAEPPRSRRLGPDREGELHRQRIEEEEENPVRTPIEEEEEDLIQTKAGVGGPRPLLPSLATQVEVARGGEPLPHVVPAFFDSRFGRDFSDVRIHRGAQAAATAGTVNARAYTIGSDISFARSQYRPHTDVGRRLLAHELTMSSTARGTLRLTAPIESLRVTSERFNGPGTVTIRISVLHLQLRLKTICEETWLEPVSYQR